MGVWCCPPQAPLGFWGAGFVLAQTYMCTKRGGSLERSDSDRQNNNIYYCLFRTSANNNNHSHADSYTKFDECAEDVLKHLCEFIFNFLRQLDNTITEATWEA